jgi:Ser/Thr protein kinase RdoA (MazF antagonist)
MDTTTERFSLPVPLEQALATIAGSYRLGTIQSFSVMLAGYQNLNVKLDTTQGSCVVKFYAGSGSMERNTDVVTVMSFLYNSGLPVPKVLSSNGAATVPILKDDGTVISYVNVLEYFDGEDTNTCTPKQEDFGALAQIIGKIHNSDLEIKRFYDDWGVANIASEYPKTAAALSKESIELVDSVVKSFEKIDSSSFHKCVIHGDLHRSNILKNKNGDYCLIDFGCVDYNLAIIDLAAFLAWFCFDGLSSHSEIETVYRTVISEYIKVRPLSKAELAALPIYIQAAYTAFHMASSELLRRGDTREETILWNNKSLSGLQKSVALNQECCFKY